MKHDPLQYFVQRVLPPVVVFAIVIGGLELLVRLLNIPRYLLPLPSAVARSLVTHRSDLFAATLTTTKAALLGFAGSIVIGVSAAIVLSTSKLVRRAIYPYTIFFQTVPVVAIAPLLINWFDPGLQSVAVSAFIVSVFPVIANTLAGLLSTDPALVDLFHLYGAGPIDGLIKLRLPYALPSIVTGLRVSAGLAVIGTIVGEFLVGTLGNDEGLGVKIVSANRNMHIDVLFAAVLLASLLGLSLFAAVNLFGYLVLRRWQPPE